MQGQLSNVRASSIEVLATPANVQRALPVGEISKQTVLLSREGIEGILGGEDLKFLVISGPCSIHDHRAAIEYAKRLAGLRALYGDTLEIVMRVYFEKPRTTVGWKGLINDPFLNESFDINKGISLAREILSDITQLGVPVATEFLDSWTTQFLIDFVSWGAIGARTTESQLHREMASGLSVPVGFKNGTNGDVGVAVNGILSARSPHCFVGFNENGQACTFGSSGNPWGHLVLRGGSAGANYDSWSVDQALQELKKKNLPLRIMVDCSHANAAGDYLRQQEVMQDVVRQRHCGNGAIVGVMIESHLNSGNQRISDKPLRYGVSITDACVGWDTTVEMIRDAYEMLKVKRG